MHKTIIEDALTLAEDCSIPWERLSHKTVLITGANGYVPAYFVHGMLKRNDTRGAGIRVIALCRNEGRARERFGEYFGRPDFALRIQDVCEPIALEEKIHFVIHAASPAGYYLRHEKPADTFRANVVGCLNALELSLKNPFEGFLLVSSVDVYGRVASVETLRETDYGYLDPLNPRNAYAVGKLAAEGLCANYHRQYGLPASIARPFQILGPGIALDDGRLHADFINQLLRNNKIVLKGDGTPKRTFMYITDAISAMFHVLVNGKRGEAYNVCDEQGEKTVLELARLMVSLLPAGDARSGACVEFDESQRDTPAVREAAPNVQGDAAKLRALGWRPRVALPEGITRMMRYYGLEARC